jgi:hypothetical protein
MSPSFAQLQDQTTIELDAGLIIAHSRAARY